MESWKSLGQFRGSLNPAIELLHHAAQFLAMVGNSYLPHQPDDSHNNLHWNGDLNRLVGRWIDNPKVQMSLDVVNFELILEAADQSHHLLLDGKTKEQVIAKMRVLLHELGLDADLLQPVSHFTIPSHRLDVGMAFQKPAQQPLQEWANCRSNAQYLLEAIAPRFDWPAEIRIWPHHFDTGIYIPVTRNEDGGDMQSIGLGLAIADANVSEPYFYINHWSSEAISYPIVDPVIRNGVWHKIDWKGFILPGSAFLSYSSAQQEKIAKGFFQDGVNATLHLMGKLPQTFFAND